MPPIALRSLHCFSIDSIDMQWRQSGLKSRVNTWQWHGQVRPSPTLHPKIWGHDPQNWRLCRYDSLSLHVCVLIINIIFLLCSGRLNSWTAACCYMCCHHYQPVNMLMTRPSLTRNRLVLHMQTTPRTSYLIRQRNGWLQLKMAYTSGLPLLQVIWLSCNFS